MTLEEIQNTQDYIINQWLKTYTPINEIAQTEDLHIENLTDTVQNLALQRTGLEQLEYQYLGDKMPKWRYSYMLLLKSESEEDYQRLINYGWLDNFIDWFIKKNKTKDFPNIPNGKVISVSCANALNYETSEDGAVSVYSLQIFFDIKRSESEEVASV